MLSEVEMCTLGTPSLNSRSRASQTVSPIFPMEVNLRGTFVVAVVCALDGSKWFLSAMTTCIKLRSPQGK